ncbi:hypothetical protein ACNQGN_09535 [Flavobacterium sp. XS2P39]
MELYNRNHTVNRNRYFDLMLHIEALTHVDFESEEKYKYFLNYINQMQRKADRHVFELNFTEARLEVAFFLWMSNFISGIVSWLK